MKVVLSVIIPTLNNISGLKYLLSFLKDKNIQMIVVDNKPTIEKKQLTDSFSSLIYLPQKKNLGFARSINLGAKFVKTKWIVILNDDIEFKNKNIFQDLISEMTEKKVDALSPILVKPNGQIENYGYRVLPYGKIDLVKSIKSVYIDGLTAACLLMKTSAFKRLRGFDDSFFAYLEDVDFFIRFDKRGYKMAVSKKLRVLHHHMTTSKTMGNFKAKQDMINWWRLYFKHKEIFRFNMDFVIERLRNFSGFLKATFSNFF